MDYYQSTFTFKEANPWAEILMTYISDLPYESFEQNENQLLAYIPKDKFVEQELAILLESFPYKEVEHQIHLIKEQNWNAEWEKNFEPILVSDSCIIRAPFHQLSKAYTYDIVIEPQMSFGTGHHQTTFLMSKHLLTMDLKGKAILDMGCGTGILAILANKLLAKNIVAIDIDEWAYNNTKDNILLNNANNITVFKGGAEILNENEKFDVIIANINRNILLNDMHAYANVLKPKGKILFSGFYTTDMEVMDQATHAFGLKRTTHLDKEGWAMLEYTK